MDQTIGIEFEVRDLGQTTRAFETIGRSAMELEKKFRVIATSMGTITARVAAMTRAVSMLSAATASLGTAATAVAASGRRMSGGMTPFMHATWAMAGAQRMATAQTPMRPAPAAPVSRPTALGMTPFMHAMWGLAAGKGPPSMNVPGGVGGGVGGGGKGGKGGFLDKAFLSPHGLIGAPMFMLRWIAFHQLFKAASASFTDLLLGAARKTVDTALIELSAISFTRSQEEQAYRAGMNLARRTGIFTTEAFIEAMSQVGSSLSIEDVGFETLRRGTEASMFGAVLTKMVPEKFAELIAQTLAATRNQKEFQGMSDAERMETITAQYVKAVEITQEWGTGFANAFRYLLPQFQQLGWSLARSLAFVGTYKTLGFHSGQIGRFGRYLSGEGLRGMANVFMEGMGLNKQAVGTPAQKQMIKRRQKVMGQVMQKILLEAMETDMDEVLYAYSDLLNKLLKQGITPGQLGVSARWSGMLLKAKEVMEEQWRLATAKIGSAEYLEVRAKVLDRVRREGLTTTRMWQGLTAMWRSFIVPETAIPSGMFIERISEIAHARELGRAIQKGDLIFDQEFRDKYIDYWSQIGGREYADFLLSITENTAKGGWWGKMKEAMSSYEIISKEWNKMWGEIAGVSPETFSMDAADMQALKYAWEKMGVLGKFFQNVISLGKQLYSPWQSLEEVNQSWSKLVEPIKKMLQEAAPPPLEGIYPGAEETPQISPETMARVPDVEVQVFLDSTPIAAKVVKRLRDKGMKRGYPLSEHPEKGPAL